MTHYLGGMSARKDRNNTIKEPIAGGGTVARNATTGRFSSVTQGGKTQNRAPKTDEVLKDVSKRRHDALKRLADR